VTFFALSIGSINVQAQSVQADEIEELIVISSRYPVALSEVVGSVASVSGDDIETRMVSDMARLLENTVGVSVKRRQAYGRTVNEGISIRGLGGKRVNILLDGVRVADAYTGYGRDLVEMDLLKRVEILKGPSSALYGSDGLAGAVSYITKDAKDLAQVGSSYLSTTAQYDSATNQHKLSVLGAVISGNLDALVQVTQRDLEEMELHDEATLSPNALSGKQNSFFSKLSYDITDTSRLSFTADIQRWEGDWDLQTDVSMSFRPPVTNTSESIGSDEGSRNRFSLDYSFSEGLAWFDEGKISLYSQSSDQDQITTKQKQTFGNGLASGPTELASEYTNFQFDQSIAGLSVELFKGLQTAGGQRHQIVYGVDYEVIDVERPREKLSTNLMTGAETNIFSGDVYPNKTFPDTETKRTGLFVNDRILLSDKATLVLGVRYDSYELTPQPDALYNNSNVAGNDLAFIDDGAFSTKLGFMYDVSDQISAFAQYAEGFRSPDYESANLTFTNFAHFYSVAPNPNLKSEESSGIELGLRGNHRDLSWSLALYETDYENFIDTAVTGSTASGITIYQYKNLDEASIKGVEASVTKYFSNNLKTVFSANRTYGTSNGETMNSIDPTKAVLSVTWTSDNNRINVKGVTSMVASGPNKLAPICGRSGCNDALELPGRVIYDLYAGYKFNDKLSTKIAIRNITDVKYWEWGSVNGKTADDSNLDLLLETGRQFSAELKLVF
jgi:hemoglobin/transferrin/lactoferrin receptor protein